MLSIIILIESIKENFMKTGIFRRERLPHFVVLQVEKFKGWKV